MLKYKEVEAILARVNGVRDSALPAFKGRIIHLQRLGISPSSPGRGAKISYSVYDVLLWAYCFELEQFGIDPKMIKENIGIGETLFFDAFKLAGEQQGVVLLKLYPRIMAAELNDKYLSESEHLQRIRIGASIINADDIEPDLFFPISRKTIDGLGIYLDIPDEPYNVFGRRLALINMTMLRQQFEEALHEIAGVSPAELKAELRRE